MYAQVEKPKENSFPTKRQESRAVANSVGQKKSNGKQGFGFVDNRTEVNMLQKLKGRDDNPAKLVTSTNFNILQRKLMVDGSEFDTSFTNKELKKIISKRSNTEAVIETITKALNLRDMLRFERWIDVVHAAERQSDPSKWLSDDNVKRLLLSSEEPLLESQTERYEKGKSTSSSVFTRTGHALSAHATSVEDSVVRAIKKGNTYNGRWKNDQERDKLIKKFYGYLRSNNCSKGAYFVKYIIPLSVGCADDQTYQEHQCDGFFIKMSSMGTSQKKWKFSTCYPTLEAEVKGSVTKVTI